MFLQTLAMARPCLYEAVGLGVEAFLPSGGLRDNKEDETRTHITDTQWKGGSTGEVSLL